MNGSSALRSRQANNAQNSDESASGPRIDASGAPRWLSASAKRPDASASRPAPR